jgi:membrane protease YdiL (CAAX protease family)
VLYYLAFLLPICLSIYNIREENPDKSRLDFGIKLNTDGIITALPLFLPIISVTALISFATSEFMELFGKSNTTVFDEPFALALLLHALIPAVFEELLFRYVPLKLLKDDPRCAVTVSAILFAFAHVNAFQIPYALFAGLLFAMLCYATGSVITSIIAHTLNNVFSLIIIYGYDAKAFYIAAAVLLAISAVFIILRRKLYLELIKKTLEGKVIISKELLIFMLITAALAVSNLF